MGCEYKLNILLALPNPYNEIVNECDLEELHTSSGLALLKLVTDSFDIVERFNTVNGLEDWKFIIDQSDDGGVEFEIIHSQLDIVSFYVTDDDDYSLEEIVGIYGIDSIYIGRFDLFIHDQDMTNSLRKELSLWLQDSYLHPHSPKHLNAVLDTGTNLPVFTAGLPLEFILDEDEIYIGPIDDEEEVQIYNLSHEDFDPEDPLNSLEQGQEFEEFDDEDDDWSDEYDETEDDDWSDEEIDDWDTEEEIPDEWEPSDALH